MFDTFAGILFPWIFLVNTLPLPDHTLSRAYHSEYQKETRNYPPYGFLMLKPFFSLSSEPALIQQKLYNIYKNPCPHESALGSTNVQLNTTEGQLT